jgi:hypothetical protein
LVFVFVLFDIFFLPLLQEQPLQRRKQPLPHLPLSSHQQRQVRCFCLFWFLYCIVLFVCLFDCFCCVFCFGVIFQLTTGDVAGEELVRRKASKTTQKAIVVFSNLIIVCFRQQKA